MDASSFCFASFFVLHAILHAVMIFNVNSINYTTHLLFSYFCSSLVQICTNDSKFDWNTKPFIKMLLAIQTESPFFRFIFFFRKHIAWDVMLNSHLLQMIISHSAHEFIQRIDLECVCTFDRKKGCACMCDLSNVSYGLLIGDRRSSKNNKELMSNRQPEK